MNQTPSDRIEKGVSEKNPNGNQTRQVPRYCNNYYDPDELCKFLDSTFEGAACERLREILTGFYSQALSATELAASLETFLEKIECEEKKEAERNPNTGSKYT